MNYKVDTTDTFKREAKRLIKKYPSLKNELAELGNSLSLNPKTGIHLGNDIYKIRLAVKSKGKGTRSGTRIMTKVKIINETVYLFSIYSKGEKNNISDKEIKNLIKEIPK